MFQVANLLYINIKTSPLTSRMGQSAARYIFIFLHAFAM